MNSSRTLWPIGILCCLGLVLFLIASAIILALIPLYLPNRTLSQSQNNVNNKELIYVEYRGTSSDGAVGSVNNIDAIKKQYNNQLGFSNNEIDVTKVQIIQDSNAKKRRHLDQYENLSYEEKRATNTYRILLTCIITYLDSCLFISCRSKYLGMIQNRIAQQTHVSFQFSFDSLPGSIFQYESSYIGFTTSVPVQFADGNGGVAVATSTVSNNLLSTTTQSIKTTTLTNSTKPNTCNDLDDCDVCDDGLEYCNICDESFC